MIIMSTIFKTRISQQEVQAPSISAEYIVGDNLNVSSIQNETSQIDNAYIKSLSALDVDGTDIKSQNLNTENLAVTNDVNAGKNVLVTSGNVFVAKGGTVSFIDDGEIIDENNANGFPVFSGVPRILNNGTIYDLGQLSGDTDLSIIEFNGTNAMVQTCEIWFSTGAETYNVIWPSDTFWIDSATGAPPELYSHMNYRIVLRKEINKIVANVAYYYPVIA